MQVVKLLKIDNSMGVVLPPWVVEALHLQENDGFVIEVVAERIVLRRATGALQKGWEAYQAIEPRYRRANRKLAE